MGVSVITSVETAANSYDLTTLAAVKADLGITGTTEDPWLTTAISRASADISNYCNRVFVRETIKDIFLPSRESFPWMMRNGQAVLRVTRWPIVSVDTVTENGVTLTADTDYVVSKSDGVLIRLSSDGFPISWGGYRVVVTYEAGYAAIPPELEGACARLVKTRRAARTRDPNVRSEDIPGVRAVTYQTTRGVATGNFPDEILDAIDNYRVPVIA